MEGGDVEGEGEERGSGEITKGVAGVVISGKVGEDE